MEDSHRLMYFNDGLKFGYDQAKVDIASSIESKMELLSHAINDNPHDKNLLQSLSARLQELKAVLTIIKTSKFKIE
jgi:hypothetical protein